MARRRTVTNIGGFLGWFGSPFGYAVTACKLFAGIEPPPRLRRRKYGHDCSGGCRRSAQRTALLSNHADGHVMKSVGRRRFHGRFTVTPGQWAQPGMTRSERAESHRDFVREEVRRRIMTLTLIPDGAELPPDGLMAGQPTLNYRRESYENCAALLAQREKRLPALQRCGPWICKRPPDRMK